VTEPVDPDCVFCAIVAGREPVSEVYRDERALALMTIGPVTPGHLMVIPLGHYPYLADLPPDLGAHLFTVAQRMAAAIRASGLRCEGINLFLADGEAAFQEVFHAHLHVFARYEGDGFELESPAFHGPGPERAELDANARLIVAALGRWARPEARRRRAARGRASAGRGAWRRSRRARPSGS
jgi:histidine triad (HIT) family protein